MMKKLLMAVAALVATMGFAFAQVDVNKADAAALDAVKGDIKAKKQIIASMEGAEIDSPRGKWKMSKAHNPIQDFYLREAKGEENRYVAIAHKALSDPGTGCKLA